MCASTSLNRREANLQAEILRNFGVMASLAAAEVDGSNSELQQRLISHMMLACAQKLHGQSICGGSNDDKEPRSKKAQQQRQEQIVDMTDQLLPVLSDLLVKFKTDTDVIASLVALPQYMASDRFASSRSLNQVKGLLLAVLA